MFKKFTSNTEITEIFADHLTPVGIYSRIREEFPESMLLESSDYLPGKNCFTYIGVNPVSSIKLENGNFTVELPDKSFEKIEFKDRSQTVAILEAFKNCFTVKADKCFDFIANGLFGYITYDSVEYYEKLQFKDGALTIPVLKYNVFEFIIAINHYKNQIFVLKNNFDKASACGHDAQSLIKLINSKMLRFGSFKSNGAVQSNMTDEQHLEMIAKCKKHIQRGDIFQIVPSRSFTVSYEGDDFQVYRALRKINPSPYVFYYDFGSYRIFGSSPEAELVIKEGRAQIHPIAGTCPRLEDDSENDRQIAELLADPKENSEHVMLVDLARNDLNKYCADVRVDSYREVQKFSHVNHLVSVVSGKVPDNAAPFTLLFDTFPAGTLTGAPKYRAMQLIDDFEPDRRSFYGGALGYVGFNGEAAHAILIRSFLSQDGKLVRRAGGGVVSESKPEKEVQEVINKLKALEKAIIMAEGI
jgi:anthranilate synthase component 1